MKRKEPRAGPAGALGDLNKGDSRGSLRPTHPSPRASCVRWPPRSLVKNAHESKSGQTGARREPAEPAHARNREIFTDLGSP